MSKSYRDIIEHVTSWLGPLRKDIPQTMQAFHALSQAGQGEELIALALGVAARCDPCLGYHAQALVRLGCTRAELEEMLAVCVYMGGGPSLMYAANALAAYEEFGGEKAATAA